MNNMWKKFIKIESAPITASMAKEVIDNSGKGLNAFDLLLAFGVALTFLLLLIFTAPDIGYTRDEGFYFEAARQYIGWYNELADNFSRGKLGASFEKANIDRYFSYNWEHPVLMKTLFAFSHKLLHQKLQLFSLEGTAYRFPAMLFSAFLLILIYLFGRQAYSRLAGLGAVLTFALMPRVFFHAHLACFDMPITFFWFLCFYLLWRSRHSRLCGWLAGAAWGLSLCVKLNSFFIPPVYLIFYFITNWKKLPRLKIGRVKIPIPRLETQFISMAILGPAIFFVHWPYIWHDTFTRIWQYLSFHLHHVHYPVEYFGVFLDTPPFPIGYPFVMSLITTPVALLLLFGFGFISRIISAFNPEDSSPKSADYLVAINLIIPFILIALPSTPIFGGIKHWLPAIPFLALMAGWGFHSIYQNLRSFLSPQLTSWGISLLLMAILICCFFIPPVLALGHNYPHGTSYYNILVGGNNGSGRYGLPRQFWGYTSLYALPELNKHSPKEAKVYFHNTTWYSYDIYKREGRLRDDIVYAGDQTLPIPLSQFSLYHHAKEKRVDEMDIWRDYQTVIPKSGIYLDGVPIMLIYQRMERHSTRH